MKNKFRRFAVVAITAAISMSVFADTLTEDFESGKISDGWTSTGSVTIKKDNGSNRAAMGGNATLSSPALKGVTSVAYKHRGSGNNKQLIVEASADGGSSWTQIGTSNVSSSSSYGSASHSVSLSMSDPVIVRFTCMSATIYVDDIIINYIEQAEEPTTASDISVTDITGDAAAITLNPGNGEGRLLAYTEGNGFSWKPTDGVVFSGNFPKKVDDVIILASGDIDTYTLSSLVPGHTYTVCSFEYNGDSEARNYQTSVYGEATFTTLTVPVISFSSSSIDFKNTKVGTTKTKQLTVNGIYLEPEAGNVTLSLPASSQFSFENGAKSLKLPYTDSTINESIVIIFSPSEYTDYETTLTATCGSATKSMTLKGRGADNDNFEYFIAPDGDDTADGSFEHPWLNLQKAVNVALPGDVIYCRGGRYHFTQRDSSNKLTVRIKNSGTPEAPITICAYEDEQPIFDFEQQLIDCNRDRNKVGDRGILLTGNYWNLYGLHITHAADNGIKLEGSHNRIERCEFSYNLDTGLQLGFGHNFSDSGFGSKNDGSYCAYNDIIDCDSHHNCDFDANYGSDADGFACKMHNGKENRFIRCRAWRNSDDAWDLYETDFSVYLIECWAWESGNAEDHTWVYEYFDKGPGFSGNGNGIKLGGNGSGGSSQGVHYAYNCVAFGCDKSGSTKGFDCNSHKGGHVVVGGLAFDNGYDFMFESGGGANSEFYNNVCFGRQEILVGTESHNALGVTPNQGKTFFNNVITDFSRSDYESLEEADALAPRGEDGSMPAKFARLKSGSKLVDAGRDINIPFTEEFPFLYQPAYGLGRDLGPYELKEGNIQSSVQMILTDKADAIFDVISSGRSNEQLIKVAVPQSSEVTVSVFSISGVLVATLPLGNLEAGAEYTFPLSTDNIAAGVYILSTSICEKTYTRKIIVK